MAKFFKHYPRELYTLQDKPQALDSVTNICTRFSFEAAFKENASTYYEYEIKEGETPELLAHKLYGSSELHWIILLLNNIIDPYYDWPMSQNVFKKYLNIKYNPQATANNTSSIKWATENTKSWYITEKQTTNEKSSFTTIETDQGTWANANTGLTIFQLDDGTSIRLEVTKDTKSFYTYEVEENEKKRLIKLVRPELTGTLSKEFKKVIS